MALSLLYFEQVKDLTTCPVCFRRYDNDAHKPKFLQCSHTACVGCVTKIFQNRVLLCPVCRRPSQVPAVGVRGLPNNHYALLLVESLSFSSSTATPTPEATCRREPAADPGPADWCFTCGRTAAAICGLSKFHTTSRLSAEGVQAAQKLQTLIDQTKQNWARAATDRRRIQGQLQTVLGSLRSLQLRLETDIEENDSHLAELISLLDFGECDNSISAANFDKKVVEYQDLLTQSESKVSTAKNMITAMDRRFTTDDSSSYRSIVSYIDYLKDKEDGVQLEPKTAKTGISSVTENSPLPSSSSAGNPATNPDPTPQTSPPETPSNTSGPARAVPTYNFNFPFQFRRQFRLDIKQEGIHFGTAELMLLHDLPLLTSSVNTASVCSIKAAYPNAFVAIGDFIDVAESLPDLQSPFASKEGYLGIYKMTQSQSIIQWSFIVITGTLKVTPRNARTFARITGGLDVFNRLSNLARTEKEKPLEIVWTRL